MSVVGSILVSRTFISRDTSQNEVVIEYRGECFSITPERANPTATTNTVMVFGMLSYANVLDGLQCSNSCQEKEGFEVGIVSDTPPTCVACDRSLFRRLRVTEVEDICVCDEGYRENNGVCEPCDDPLCQICVVETSTCNSCVLRSTFDANSACQCFDGYYPNNRECLECPFGCQTCTSPMNCGSCK